MAERILIGAARQPVVARAAAAAAPIVEGHGLKLLGAELAQEGRHKVLWIYIDLPDVPESEEKVEGEVVENFENLDEMEECDRPQGVARGVTIEDCARVSPEISAALDVEDPISEAYELRVSSPGLDRPLMSDEDFRRFVGREVMLQLSASSSGRRKFTGKIAHVEGDLVHLICSDGEFDIQLGTIQKARLRYELAIGKLR